MRAMLRALGCLLLVSALLPAAHAGVSASVDRARLGASESLQLRIRSDSVISVPDPDLKPLGRDFEILSTSRNARVSMVDGATESYTEWVLELMPRRAGELQIPAIGVGKDHTDPIKITVSTDPPANAASDREVMLEAELDRERVHVQQQLLLTVRVLHAINFNRGATLDPPVIDNAVVRPIGERSYEKMLNGQRYGVFERRYALFPQSSGELRIPALAFQATVGGGGGFFDAFGARAHTLRLATPERRVQVLPPESGANPWVPASVLTLVETWDKNPAQLRVGESATRTLTITATGLTGAQLPVLAPPTVDGLRFYPDQAEVTDQQQDDGITGTRVERSAVIPLRADNMELPEVRLRWWDTVNQRFEEALVPRKTIRVLPASGSSAPVTPAATSKPSAPDAGVELPATPPAAEPAATPPGSPPWPWIIATLLMAFAAMVSAIGWWRVTRGNALQTPGHTDTGTSPRMERELFARLRNACRSGRAAEVHTLLPEWARHAFPDKSPRTLADVMRLAQDPRLENALNQLLATRYGNAPQDWNPHALLDCLEALRKQATRPARPQMAAGLAPLYPG